MSEETELNKKRKSKDITSTTDEDIDIVGRSPKQANTENTAVSTPIDEEDNSNPPKQTSQEETRNPLPSTSIQSLQHNDRWKTSSTSTRSTTDEEYREPFSDYAFRDKIILARQTNLSQAIATDRWNPTPSALNVPTFLSNPPAPLYTSTISSSPLHLTIPTLSGLNPDILKESTKALINSGALRAETNKAFSFNEDLLTNDDDDDEEIREAKKIDQESYPLPIRLLPPESRTGSFKNTNITTALLFRYIFRKYPSYDDAQSSINTKGTLALLMFRDEKERNEAKANPDFFKDFATLDSKINASSYHIYYRTVISIHSDTDNNKEFSTRVNTETLSAKLKETFGLSIDSATINESKQLATIYFSSRQDWLKAFKGMSIFLDDVYALRFLHHFASTNDPDIFKMYISPIPQNWKALQIKGFLKSDPISLPKSCIVASAVAQDPNTNLSRRLAFTFIKGSEFATKAVNWSERVTLREKYVKIQLAKGSNRKK